MRVLVCGTREEVADLNIKVRQRLSELEAEGLVDVVIEGGADGVDFAGGEWADDYEITHIREPAKWRKTIPYKKAGPIRNQKMLDDHKPDLVLAFHTDPGLGKGTADMVRRARKAGVPVEVHVLAD